MNSKCPFCNLEPGRKIILESSSAFSVFDKFPVSKGHALIIPKRHCKDYFDLSVEEQLECWKIVNEVEKIISEKYHPDGFNIGININEVAGQTVFHVHIHLIPRYTGDVEEPQGGVRGIIFNKQSYDISSK